MIILVHKKFKKSLKKLPAKIRGKFYDKIHIFQHNPLDKRLDNHALVGKYSRYRSIAITGDYRVIFEEIDSEKIELEDIGTHSQLYG